MQPSLLHALPLRPEGGPPGGGQILILRQDVLDGVLVHLHSLLTAVVFHPAEPESSSGAEVVEVAGLDVARGDVVQAGVAEHVVAHTLGRHVPAALLDDDRQLGLVLDTAALRRQHDGIVGADDGARRLEEDAQLVREGDAHLGGVVAIVEAHGDHLGRQRRRQQHDLLEGVAAAAAREAGPGGARVLDDARPLEDTEPGLAGGPEPDDLHQAIPRTSCME